MSKPNRPDYIVIEMGNGATPEVFSVVCGMEGASLNQTANTSDQFSRDCEFPADVPTRDVRVTGIQWDVTGTGVVNMDEIERMQASIGNRSRWRVLYGKFDDAASIPRTGTIFGYYAGSAVMTAFNQSLGDESTAEITLAGEGRAIWTEGEPA